MTNRSWAEEIDFKCPNCQAPLRLQNWVLIDSQERPDLVKRIGSDTLNTMTCPNCKSKTALDVPLLLYRADPDRPLIFSPSRQISQERESGQLRQLLARLQQQPETIWINEFTFGIQGVKRERLASFLGIDLKAILTAIDESIKVSEWERVIDLTSQALEILGPGEDARTWEWLRSGRAAAQCELAAGYLEQIGGERASNVEKAIYYGRKALEVFTPDNNPDLWATAHHNLAIAYLNRITEDREKNLRQAILHHLEALKFYTFNDYPKDWAIEQEGLANVYCEIYSKDRSGNLEEAIHLLTRTLDVYTAADMPLEYARAMNNLALAYIQRMEGDRARNLKRAEEVQQDCLKAITREAFPYEWAVTHLNLAKTCHDLCLIQTESRLLDQAIIHLQQALEIFTSKRFPERNRQCQRNLGFMHFKSGRFQQAHSAYVSAIDTDRSLLKEAYTESGRRSEISETRNAYSLDAYCLMRLGQPGEALVRLEQGKARLLAENLALADADLLALPEVQRQSVLSARQAVRELEAAGRALQDTADPEKALELAEELHLKRQELNQTIETIRAEHPDFMPPGLDLPGLLALAPEGGALIVPVITPLGGMAFVIPHGTTTLTESAHCLMLECTTENETAWLWGTSDLTRTTDLTGWEPCYHKYKNNTEAWKEVIDHTGQILWKELLGPIQRRLAELGLDEGAPVVFITPGGLNLLPLHAAWRDVNGVKRYLIDDYTVSYGPSGYALHVSRRRLRESKREQKSLLVVIDPTSDLTFASSEGKAVAEMFRDYPIQSLPAETATVDEVLSAAHGKTHLHFACHGYYDLQRPMNSGLLLAGKEPLTLSRILSDLDLTAARLIALSACETGLTDIGQSPDEFLGLSAGLMQAGAPVIMSSLWSVDDLSTRLLMELFYTHYLKGMTTAAALRKAQKDLRDLTSLEITVCAERAYQEADKRNKLNLLKHLHYFRSLAESNPGLRPFDHPYYWAAFTVNGMG
jgi:CHAT domain-containing protein